MDKQHAHQLLDELDPGQFEAVVRQLEVMTDSVNVNDEFVTEEEERAVAASHEWFENHPGTSFEDVVAELGFTE